MGIVGGIAALIAVLVTLTAALAVYPRLWRAYRDQWRRIPPERRSRAWVGFGLTVVACVVVGVLLIVNPWGSHTVLWVCLLGGGGVMLFALVGAAGQAVIDVRRARKQRAENP